MARRSSLQRQAIKIFAGAWIWLGLFVSLFHHAEAQNTGFIDIENGTLHYKVFGVGQPLLFLNGGPGFSSAGYENIARELQTLNRQVVLFDQRGTGRSIISPIDSSSITIDKMVEDIERLRQHLQIETWDVVGQSFGGSYAIYYISRYPDRINKLVLYSTPAPRVEKFSDFKAMDYLEDDYRVQDMEIIDKLVEMRQAVLDSLSTTNNDQQIVIDSLDRCFLDLKTRVLRAKYYVKKKENIPIAIDWFFDSCRSQFQVRKLVNQSIDLMDIRHNLLHYHKPVLILHGEDDFIKTAAPKTLQHLFPLSELKLIKNCGHLIWLDQPDEVKSNLMLFLNTKKRR